MTLDIFPEKPKYLIFDYMTSREKLACGKFPYKDLPKNVRHKIRQFLLPIDNENLGIRGKYDFLKKSIIMLKKPQALMQLLSVQNRDFDNVFSQAYLSALQSFLKKIKNNTLSANELEVYLRLGIENFIDSKEEDSILNNIMNFDRGDLLRVLFNFIPVNPHHYIQESSLQRRAMHLNKTNVLDAIKQTGYEEPVVQEIVPENRIVNTEEPLNENHILYFSLAMLFILLTIAY